VILLYWFTLTMEHAYIVYVDDILITGKSSSLVTDLIQKLDTQFALKNLGKLNYFLGIEVNYLSNGSILLNQTKYVHDLLCKANMDEAEGIGSPMVSSC
jgi:uncharacterized membrane protein